MVEDDVKEVIMSMVSLDPAARPSIKKILKNPFFSDQRHF